MGLELPFRLREDFLVSVAMHRLHGNSCVDVVALARLRPNLTAIPLRDTLLA